MDITFHVAVANNGTIGRDGTLPWRLSTDLKRFKVLTMGKPIIMGRRTWESFPVQPLPGRLNIIVTRNRDFTAEGAEIVHSVGEALELAAGVGAEEACIIGGGEIFRQTMADADRLHVTHVLADVEGETNFPAIDERQWQVRSQEDVPAGEKDSHPTRYVVYERRH